MATADDAKKRLMAGMRKSKSGATKKKAAAGAGTTAGSTRKTSASRKTTPRRAPAAASGTGKATPAGRSPGAIRAAAIAAVTLQTSSDPYQSNGRIWPD